jgi:hypothetical protein
MRAPGEGVAPGEPGSVGTADAINAYLRAEAMFADPLGMARAALVTPELPNLPETAGNDPTPPPMDAPETRVATALLADDTPQQATTGVVSVFVCGIGDVMFSGGNVRGVASRYRNPDGAPAAYLGYDDVSTIKDAINAAQPGQTVVVVAPSWGRRLRNERYWQRTRIFRLIS